MSTNIVKGLGAILSTGAEFLTFEEGRPTTLLFIDWYENLLATREHYEKAMNPSYVRCPGKKVCPLCHNNPSKYPALRIKFRVYDPIDKKVKFVSLSRTHVQKLNNEFDSQNIDPTQQYVTIYRTGTKISNTYYRAQPYTASSEYNKRYLEMPSQYIIDNMPEIIPQIMPYSPEQITSFMKVFMNDPAS